MNRALKFRCWDVKARFMKDDGTLPKGMPHMKYEIGVSVGKGWFTGIDGLHVPCNDPLLPLMQYTGFDDRHKTELYDGDIISNAPLNQHLETDMWYEIYWNGRWSGRLICHHNVCGGGEIEDLSKIDLRFFERIGNIYENPELIPAISNTFIR